MRICDYFLDDGVAAAGIDVRNAVAQGVIGKTLTFRLEMTFFVMEESLPIRDEILKVPDLGTSPLGSCPAAQPAQLGARFVPVSRVRGGIVACT